MHLNVLTISNQITSLLTSVIHLKSVCVTCNGLSKAYIYIASSSLSVLKLWILVTINTKGKNSGE